MISALLTMPPDIDTESHALRLQMAVESLVEARPASIDPALERKITEQLLYLYEEAQQSQTYIVHIEWQSNLTSEDVPRMVGYLGLLYRKYRQAIRQVLLYPFEGKNLPTMPWQMLLEDEVLAWVNLRVVGLSNYSAREVLSQGLVEIYALLPTMGEVNYEVLLQGIERMRKFYEGEDERLRNHLLWFDTFLKRSKTVSTEDKEKIVEELGGFDSLLDEGYFVSRRKAEMFAKGLAEGREEGLAEGEVKAVVTLIELRFPPLVELAQEKVPQINRQERLNLLLKKAYTAPDETTMREFLEIAA